MATLTINGASISVDADPQTPVLWVLREHLELIGTKFGRGACTVHVGDQAVFACHISVEAVGDSPVTTIEGLSEAGDHPLQRAWIAEQVPQCGYCQPGQIMRAAGSRVSAWRGIGSAPNCSARECFIDELATAAGIDPVVMRRKLLAQSPRGLAVLDAMIAMAGFGKAPPGRAHGLSFAGYKSTLGAGVAEVSLDGATGQIRVHRFWAAVDPGFAIHPKNLNAQVEGGILFGLSGLLKERISIAGGEVEQNNFYDYEPLRIHEMPEIEIRIVESGAAPSGGGEIGVPMTGAAVANAVHVLTGKRLRQMPFTPERVKAVMSN